MSLIPERTVYSVQRRLLWPDHPTVVKAVQRGLNVLGWTLLEDGVFGKQTLRVVKRFQETRGLTVDGKFGPLSSKRLAMELPSYVSASVPQRLLEGFSRGESGDLIGAVNWSVYGGVDCGYLQRRVFAGSYEVAEVVDEAFDPLYQFDLLARTLRERYSAYQKLGNWNERSWRLAALHHNWPWAANELANGRLLPNREAIWVPEGTRFDDGAPVVTWKDWADFYCGLPNSHDHPGLVTRYVENWIANAY
jgi:peptidoglycan hydrolase-like protein with peptidoglycan-binding domain